MIVLVAAVTALALRGIGRRGLGRGASTARRLGLAGVVFVLILGEEQWSHVLYGRNVVAALIAVALLVLVTERPRPVIAVTEGVEQRDYRRVKPVEECLPRGVAAVWNGR